MLRILALMIALMAPLRLMAQGHSFVRNYDDRRLSDGPTWDIKPARGGYVYCSNGENLLTLFNGAFRQHQMPTEIRCTFVADTAVYVGGVNELGYMTPQDDGSMVYHSLAPLLDSLTRKSLGNIWKIYEYDHATYFVADALVVKYIGGRVSVLDPDMRICASTLKSGVLYVAGMGEIKYVMGQDFKELHGCEILGGRMVKGFAGYGNGLIAVTDDCIFYHDGYRLSLMRTAADSLLKNAVVFCTADGGGTFAVGTVKGGVTVIDKDDFSCEIINTSNGLKDNTVISLAYSSDGSLWAGLNNGLNEILLSSPLKSICTDDAVGAGTGMAESGGGFYFATTRGVYYAKRTGKGFAPMQPVKGLETVAWRLYKAFGNVYCLHDRGVFRLDGLRAVPLGGGVTGFWGMVQVGDSAAFAATYSELFAVRLRSDGGFDLSKIDLMGSFYNMAFDGACVWFHYKGTTNCVKATYIASENRLGDVVELTEGDGLPADKHFNIQVVDGNVYALSMLGVYIYDRDNGRFAPVDSIGGLNCKHGFVRLTQSGKSLAGLSNNSVELALDGRSVSYSFNERYADPSPLNADIVLCGDTALMIASKKGFHFININDIASHSDTAQILSTVYIADSLAWQGNSFGKVISPEIPYNQANVKFFFGNRGEPAHYSYRLRGKDGWSAPAPLAFKEYTSLREGRYEFEVRKLSMDGRVVGHGSFSFRVLPPWYRTWPAYAVYFMLAVMVAYLIYKAVRKHYRRKQMMLEEKNREDIRKIEIQHEMESAADKQRIYELEKQKLKDDLEHKTTELADMALSLASKNEILSDLKGELEQIFKSEALSAQLKRKLGVLNSKIDANIQNDNLIDRFEEQFDLLHNNFIRKMKSAYPQLSRNDYMLCAYIRMELSTKEIAQMLNMSVRGVESQKYRLKKKINLEEDLNEYLKRVENG